MRRLPPYIPPVCRHLGEENHPLHSLIDVVVCLRSRGLVVSPSTVQRLIRKRIVPTPPMIGGHRVWTDAALDELERSIRSYRDRRGQSATATA
jgi:hypothetical protein